MQNGFLIKITHMNDRIYYLDKSGYVRDLDNIFFDDDVYTTYGRCNAVCKRKSKQLQEDIAFAKSGIVKNAYIPDLVTYEPYEINF